MLENRPRLGADTPADFPEPVVAAGQDRLMHRQTAALR